MCAQFNGLSFGGASVDEEELQSAAIPGQRIHGGKGNRKVLPVHFNKDDVSNTLEYFGIAQDYNQLKSQCLEDGILFEDPEFPADESSLFYSGKTIGDIEWLRPSEIVDDPRFFVDGGSRFDVKQGRLGDCWLLAAIANLTLNEKLLHIVVPEDNSFTVDYCGIFHFRFWQYGEWVDVVVDDKLPAMNGRLCFMRSDEAQEFWSALLEKAYAKLHGTYEALEGGLVCEALVDFTGGITEMYNLKEGDKQLFDVMERAVKWCSFMGCSLETGGLPWESEAADGLVMGHAYSITSVKRVDTPDGTVNLLRLRNPWGNDKEWTGPWSDESEEWHNIPDDEKEAMGLTFDHDGEFWMSYEDFSQRFDSLEICNLSKHDLLEGMEVKGWQVNKYEGSWIKGATAGGCLNNRATFACNPQYIIHLDTPDEDDEDGKCTVLISLMQKNRRQMRRNGMDCLPIGFVIYSLNDEDHPKPLPINFFMYNQSVGRSTYINLREVCYRFNLDPGTYVIVPTTFYANEEGDFLLRVFTETSAGMEENDDDIGTGEVDERVGDVEEDEHAQELKNFFLEVAGDDGDVDWKELKGVLDQGSPQEFSPDICRSLVALMDKSMTGKLNFGEFVALLRNLVMWQKVFQFYVGEDGFSSFELRKALVSTGYHVNHKVLEALILRYGDDGGHIQFNDFIACVIKLKTMIDIFKKRSEGTEDTNTALFTLEEWVTTTIYS